MINLNKTLVIIDGNSIINRAFYALPEMSNKEGLKTNAIYGFTNGRKKRNRPYVSSWPASSMPTF